MLEVIQNVCDHLVERTATLFLGAGVNAGLTNKSGVKCPFAADLSEWICRDLLGSPDTRVGLDDAVEMAQHKLGLKAVNDYLYSQLAQFEPGAAHLALVQLPWDVIYTTNFDLLVEKAAGSGTVVPAGNIRQVLTSTVSLTGFLEADILYYKLHGSIDVANTQEGRLILTKSDYRFYEQYKRPLFRRLRVDLLSRTFVFVGYALGDVNFRAILDDCREELGAQTLPLSYAIQNDFSALQEAFWRDKYNIQLVKGDATEFLVSLRDTWYAQDCKVVPFLQRKAVEYLNIDQSSRFQKVGDSFYLLRPADCTGNSKPSAFFRGAEPSWADIRDRIGPVRDVYESILESIFPELADPQIGPSAALVTGAAGSGKTTLVRTIAYDVAKDFNIPVFIHIPGTPLDPRVLTPLIRSDFPARFLIVIHYAGEHIRHVNLFWEEVRQKKLPFTLLLEERKNQWLVAKSSVPTQLNVTEFELGTLSEVEINNILDALERHGCLEKLTGLPREEQVAHFTALAHQDLLVALRELTSQTRFDEIVKDEYAKIPSELARAAYVYVAAVGQLDLAVRYATLVHILNLTYSQLGPDILLPTEGILITGEETGASRHNVGFRLRTRHPIIASVIFAVAASDDAAKFEILNGLLSRLDPGYPDDMRLLIEIVRSKEIVNTFAEHAMRRALYDRISALLPGNPYVYQHRSMIEREMRDGEQAIYFARLAVKADPKNAALQNTLGLALEFAARSATDSLKRQALLSEAGRIFDEGIQRDRRNPYDYLGKFYVIRQNVERERNPDARDELIVTGLSFLEDAYEATGESPVIATELARVREQLGSLEHAIKIVDRAVRKYPSNSRLRQLLVAFQIEKGDLKQALTAAVDAAKTDPTSWRIQRSLARLRRDLGENVQAVRGHYEAALRHHKGDVGLVVEYGAYLFREGLYGDAKSTFDSVSNLTMSAQERSRIREMWSGADQKPTVFQGRISRIAGAKGVVLAIPQNFEAFFWRTTGTSLLREGDEVRFTVGFNAHGPVARNIARHVL
jgi:tetratricopeptide (TPR) repeat protein